MLKKKETTKAAGFGTCHQLHVIRKKFIHTMPLHERHVITTKAKLTAYAHSSQEALGRRPAQTPQRSPALRVQRWNWQKARESAVKQLLYDPEAVESRCRYG